MNAIYISLILFHYDRGNLSSFLIPWGKDETTETDSLLENLSDKAASFHG
jgi:hypothetical protein